MASSLEPPGAGRAGKDPGLEAQGGTAPPAPRLLREARSVVLSHLTCSNFVRSHRKHTVQKLREAGALPAPSLGTASSPSAY